MIIRSNTDYTTLATEMLPAFKEHLRIIYDTEDSSITQYLAGAMDAISIYGDVDIFLSDYEYVYIDGEINNPEPATERLYTTRINISDVLIEDTDATDITADYTVNAAEGYIYPAPALDASVTFKAGYALQANMPPNLVSLVFRYGAHLYENREAINIGEPKFLPDWVLYAMASIWKPRV